MTSAGKRLTQAVQITAPVPMPPDAAARLKNWFIKDALPLWAARGYDAARGGFYESLDFNGEPVTAQPRRVRVQARQIFTFSESGLRGWLRNAETIAAAGFEYFLSRACPQQGSRGCVHLLSDDGSVLDDRRDLYDQAFLLLACASRWRAAKDRRALDLADKTLAFLDRELASPHGGWAESDGKELPRRQNPHMHLFEAFLALCTATGEARFRDYADKIFMLFERYFFDADAGIVREFFGDDWALGDDAADRRIQPGHMMEWVWLLKEYESIGGAYSADVCARLYERAKALGEDGAGFLVDDADPAISPAAPGPRRLWPQTEYLRAALILASAGDERAASDCALLIERLFQTYLNEKTPGLWRDRYDASGAPIARYVPASILYHLLGAAAEADAQATKEQA